MVKKVFSEGLGYLLPVTSTAAAQQHQLFLSLDLTRWVNCSAAELQVQFIGTEIAYHFIKDHADLSGGKYGQGSHSPDR